MRKLVLDFVRPNIKKLTPYSSARDEFKSTASIFLDANENPFDTEVNRYPNSAHLELKQELAELKEVAANQLLLGNGSDEVIDLVFRTFCEPRVDNIVITPPTYGMYKVTAEINDIEVKEAFLSDEFALSAQDVLAQCDEQTKIVVLCSPNNPSGNLMETSQIKLILKGVTCPVFIDEAYIDFSPNESWVQSLADYPNLIICQTFSKAWGMAGIRLGLCIASSEIIRVLNTVKPPYNINTLTEQRALQGLKHKAEYEANLNSIIAQRDLLAVELANIAFIEQVFPSDANFILIRVPDADALYLYLQDNGIIVRNRSTQYNCANTLRLTVGREEQNNKLVERLKAYAI